MCGRQEVSTALFSNGLPKAAREKRLTVTLTYGAHDGLFSSLKIIGFFEDLGSSLGSCSLRAEIESLDGAC